MLSAILTCALISAPTPIQATAQPSTQAVVRHRLAVQLEPEQHTLRGRDAISLPADGRAEEVIFTLSDALTIDHCSASLQRQEASPEDVETGLARYVVTDLHGDLLLEYGGTFDFGLSDEKEEYTRGFRESRGAVGPEGVYLHGENAWVPSLGDGMIAFVVEVSASDDWHVINQGNGASSVESGRARRDSGGHHWPLLG